MDCLELAPEKKGSHVMGSTCVLLALLLLCEPTLKDVRQVRRAKPGVEPSLKKRTFYFCWKTAEVLLSPYLLYFY